MPEQASISIYKQFPNYLLGIMEKYNFTVVIEKDEDGIYVAEVPDLKGCYTQGASLEEVMKNIREVILLCLETQKNEIAQHEFVGVQKIEVSA